MVVKEFKSMVDLMQKEIGCDGGRISSHNIPSRVTAYCSETDEFFEIKAIQATRLMGCGCSDGFEIQLSQVTR